MKALIYVALGASDCKSHPETRSAHCGFAYITRHSRLRTYTSMIRILFMLLLMRISFRIAFIHICTVGSLRAAHWNCEVCRTLACTLEFLVRR